MRRGNIKKQTRNFIPTNFSCIDKMFRGGLPRSRLSLVYGESKTGKTSFAIQCSVSCARKGLKTLFIDTDRSFSPIRLSQIASCDLDSVSPLITLFKPYSFHEQLMLIENLDRYLSKKVALVVIDTITSLYRAELGSVEETFVLNRHLNRQLAYLSKIALTNGVAVLLISQVYSLLRTENDGEVEPVATRVVRFWAQNIVNLRMTNIPKVREAILEKYQGVEYKGIVCPFILDDKGVIGEGGH